MQEATTTAKANENPNKLTAKNIIGYALGDTGGVLAFGVISSFLNLLSCKNTKTFGIYNPAKHFCMTIITTG